MKTFPRRIIGRIRLSDGRGRDALVALVAPKKIERATIALDAKGRPVENVRVLRGVHERSEAELRRRLPGPDQLATALLEGDPEIDTELFGRRAGACDRVWLGKDGEPLYAARFLDVRTDAKGEEISRSEAREIPANISAECPAVITKRRIALEEAARNYVLDRKLLVRHTDGLSFEFLHGIAASLQDQGVVAYVGAGARGKYPLILRRNGSPRRAFLEGRVRGDSFLLILHLSAFEWKAPTP